MNIGGGHMNINGRTFSVAISDSRITNVGSTSFDLYLSAIGFKIKWSGEDRIYSPAKASHAKVRFLVENASDETTLTGMFDTPTSNYYMTIYDDDNELIWWYGYITSKTPKIKNEFFPKEITIEAQDNIAALKTKAIWSNKFVSTARQTVVQEYITVRKRRSRREGGGVYFTKIPTVKYYVGPNEFPEDFGFGIPYTDIGNTPPQVYASVVEVIFSLLFDLDRFQAQDELEVIEHYDFQENPTRITGGLANTVIDTDMFLFEDYPTNKEALDITAREMLENICELFNCRIFQFEGKYYLVQNEVYQSSNNAEYYNYKYYSGTPPAMTFEPVDSNNGSYTPVQLKYSVNTPSNGLPCLLEGSSFGYTEALRKVELHSKDGQAGQSVTNKVFSIASSQGTVSLFEASSPTETVPETGTLLIANPGGIIIRRSSWPHPLGSNLIFRDTPSTSNQIGTAHQHCLMGRFDASANVNQTIGCTLADDGSYKPWKAINYSSKIWLWSEISYHSEMEEWKGRFIECDADDTNNPGYAEIIAQDEGT